MATATRQYLPSLEGIRGYAFLMVFLVHFSGTSWSLTSRPLSSYPFLLLQELSFVAVPIFFALSGYLITGILFDSKGREGYFRVFYLRRALRVFPLYYVVLFGLFFFAAMHGVQLLRRDALFLVYLHNLWPGTAIYHLTPKFYIAHLWSLAVEEQFYLLWPLAVWLIPGRKGLLAFCYGAVALAFLGRLWATHLHLDPGSTYQNTLFRSDAIMLGAALALHERGPLKRLSRLSRPALWTTILCTLVLVSRALLVGQALPYDHFGILVVIPLLAVLGAAILVLVLNPSGTLHRLCSYSWIVHLGKLSYGLYVLHQLFAPYFLDCVTPKLTAAFGGFLGPVLSLLLAFSLVYVLSRLAFRLIEQPAMGLKSRFHYGASKPPQKFSWGMVSLDLEIRKSYSR